MKVKCTSTPVSGMLSAEKAAVVHRELSRIQRESSVITPSLVVEKASSEASPLHQFFEWNNSKAAEKYRLWQARHLIAAVYILDSSDESAEPIRAFVNVSPDDDEPDFIGDRGYVALQSLSGRQSYQIQVISYAKQQLMLWRKKFGAYKEFFGVVNAIDKL